MVFFHLIVLDGKFSISRLFASLEELTKRIGKTLLVVLDLQHLVATSINNFLRDFLLAAQRIPSHNTALQDQNIKLRSYPASWCPLPQVPSCARQRPLCVAYAVTMCSSSLLPVPQQNSWVLWHIF